MARTCKVTPKDFICLLTFVTFDGIVVFIQNKCGIAVQQTDTIGK
jgi:hypothetical protein